MTLVGTYDIGYTSYPRMGMLLGAVFLITVCMMATFGSAMSAVALASGY
jgi:hypothetical protein